MTRTAPILAALAGLAALAVGAAAFAQPGGIDVTSGTYGGSCGARQGNVTRDLRESCEGRQTCDYRVDVQQLGDPAPGCQKDYVAEWRCPDGEEHRAGAPAEAGFGSIVSLACEGPPPRDYGPPPGDRGRDHDHDADQGGITVLSATYGASCRVRPGNVTRDLAQACNGRGECAYTVDVNRLGDPAPGCHKDYIAMWQCPDGRRHSASAPAEAGFGSVVTLDCER